MIFLHHLSNVSTHNVSQKDGFSIFILFRLPSAKMKLNKSNEGM
jgi:hypothetical protein